MLIPKYDEVVFYIRNEVDSNMNTLTNVAADGTIQPMENTARNSAIVNGLLATQSERIATQLRENGLYNEDLDLETQFMEYLRTPGEYAFYFNYGFYDVLVFGIAQINSVLSDMDLYGDYILTNPLNSDNTGFRRAQNINRQLFDISAIENIAQRLDELVPEWRDRVQRLDELVPEWRDLADELV